MSLSVAKCAAGDGPYIATLYTSTMTTLMKYSYGSACLEDIQRNLAWYEDELLEEIAAGRSEKVLLKVVDQDAGSMIAWADWEVPEDLSRPKPTSALRGRPLEGKNTMFCRMLVYYLNAMHDRVLKGRKSYLLNQLVTLPEHQRRGAGTMLLTWPFERADKEGAVCYLDTEADGKAISLYERHGFVKVDQCEIDLEDCGLEGVYTHVAMVREPKAVGESEGS